MAATVDIAEDTAEAAAAVDTAAVGTAEGTAVQRRLRSHTVAAERTGRAYTLEEERLRPEPQEAETPVVADKQVRSDSNSCVEFDPGRQLLKTDLANVKRSGCWHKPLIAALSKLLAMSLLNVYRVALQGQIVTTADF